MTDWILKELYALWDKLKIVFERFLHAPEILRAWSEGRASMGDRIALVASIVIIVAVIAWLVRFFKAGFWKKLGLLLSAALVILAAAVVLSFFSKAEEREEPTVPADPSAEPQIAASAPLPESSKAPAVVQATPIPRSDGQYSLARGAEDPVYATRVSERWRVTDDTVSWQLGEGTVLQLKSLHTLPGTGRFAVEEMVQYSDYALVSLRRLESSEEGGAVRRSECVVEIRIWPGAKIERMPWYAEAPSYVASGEQIGYSIFENTGRALRFLEKDEAVTNAHGDAVMALCMARQIENDVVLVTARAFTTVTDGDHVEYTELNPGMDDELKRRLGEIESALFDGRVRLLRDLTAEGLSSVLPGRVTEASVGESAGRGGFTIPCTRLLEMRSSDAYGSIIRFIGPGPKGEELLYSLVNGAALYEHALTGTDRYFTWRAGYEDGWLAPDEDMTAFLGCPAVACDGGWVLDAGSFYSRSTGAVMENYYFLSTQVLTPAPTPEPTPEPTEAPTTEGETNNG